MNDKAPVVEHDLWGNPFMSFKFNNNNYVVFSDISDEKDGDDVYFARYNIVNGQKIVEDIESDEEYNSVLNLFNNIIKMFDWNEDFDRFINGLGGEN